MNHLLSLFFLLPLAASFSIHHGDPYATITRRSEHRHSTFLSSATIGETGLGIQQDGDGMPELGRDGIYHVITAEQHRNFMERNKDKLVIVKVFAPWCKSCQALSPKFIALSKEAKYKGLPIVFADLTCQHNKDLIRAIGVKQIPSIQFCANGQVEQTIPCMPSQVPAMKKMLTLFVHERVDLSTGQVDLSFSATKVEDDDEYADELSIGHHDHHHHNGGFEWASLSNLFG